jgi:hypothetical protein
VAVFTGSDTRLSPKKSAPQKQPPGVHLTNANRRLPPPLPLQKKSNFFLLQPRTSKEPSSTTHHAKIQARSCPLPGNDVSFLTTTLDEAIEYSTKPPIEVDFKTRRNVATM